MVKMARIFALPDMCKLKFMSMETLKWDDDLSDDTIQVYIIKLTVWC